VLANSWQKMSGPRFTNILARVTAVIGQAHIWLMPKWGL
jgi:hypothetical protein